MRRGPEVIARKDGYRMLWLPDHPEAHDGRVYEHRYVAEQTIGRRLEPGEQVHHIDGDKQNNRPENLEVYSSTFAHYRNHAPLQARAMELLAEPIRSSELRTALGITPAHVYTMLKRMVRHGVAVRLEHGVYVRTPA